MAGGATKAERESVFRWPGEPPSHVFGGAGRRSGGRTGAAAEEGVAPAQAADKAKAEKARAAKAAKARAKAVAEAKAKAKADKARLAAARAEKARGPPAVLRISGAGSPEVNGDYRQDGAYYRLPCTCPCTR